MLAIAAAIGAVIVGSATIGAANATPDSPFWPITRGLSGPIERNRRRRSGPRWTQARTALDSGRTGEAQDGALAGRPMTSATPEGD